MTLAIAARRLADRRTALPAEAYERVLACVGCGQLVAVFEATLGARSEADHRFVEPDAFRCAGCLVPKDAGE